jgi:murein DD-endopeptidase MepM/ murein hydrolase activator NlpD
MKNKRLFISILAGIMAGILLLGLILSALPTKASAASSSEIKDQIEQMEKEQEGMQAEIDALKGQQKENLSEIKDIVAQKSLIEQQVGLLYQQVDSMNEQIAAYAILIADKQQELDEAEEHLAELNRKNKERIRAMEEEGKLSYWSIIFKAGSFSDLLDRLNMIQEINAADQRRLKDINRAAEEVAATQLELAVEKDELELAREDLDATELILAEKREEANALLTELIAKGEEFEALIDESEDMQSDLMKEIAQAEKDLKAAEYQEWLATYVPPTTRPKPSGNDTKPSTQAPSSSGWVKPVKSYTLTSPFGMRIHPISGKRKMHEGVDMAAPQGTPIYAAKDGKVTRTAYQAGGAGYYVSINHGDGFSSIYMHMTHYIVKSGDYVKAGQVIGYVGSTGGSTGPHLHFGISYKGTYVNPMQYI